MTLRNTKKPLRRGELAQQTGCNPETIRYYEKLGLMPGTPRDENGYRAYGDDLVRRLRFILRARQLGFTIEQIRSLLSLVGGGDYTCGEVKSLAVGHAADVRRKIADLRRMVRILDDLAAKCDGGETSQCPILDALSS